MLVEVAGALTIHLSRLNISFAEFAKSHSLVFNAAKTQLICFSQTPSTVKLDRANLVFLDSALTINSSVTHLEHILRSDLLDDDDIVAVTRDICRKANCVLQTFSCCDPVVRTNLLRCFCLSLYGCGLWKIPYG